MRKEDKMTGKGNAKRYYLPRDREGLVWVIKDRNNGNQVAFSFPSRDLARYYMQKLNQGSPIGVGHLGAEVATGGSVNG